MSGVVKSIAKPVQKAFSFVGDISGFNAQQQAADLAREAADRALAPRSTQYGSSVNPRTGYTYIDPSIRTMRESVLQNLPGYRSAYSTALGGYSGGVNDYLTRTRGYMGELESNLNPYIQARVNPLLERAAAGRGSLERSLVSRGLGGSSFAAQSMGNYDTQTSRAEGDARAQALAETLAARDSMSQNMLGAQQGMYQAQLDNVGRNLALDTQIQSVAAQNLQQELSALGLSQADISSIINAAGAISGTGKAQADLLGRVLDAGAGFVKGMKAPSTGGI